NVTHYGSIVNRRLSRRDTRNSQPHARFSAEPPTRLLFSRTFQHPRHRRSLIVGCQPGALPIGDHQSSTHRRSLLASSDHVLFGNGKSSSTLASLYHE